MMADDGEEDQSGWGEACRREAAIRDLLDRHPERLTINAVELVACELGLSRPTLYRLIARYRLTRTVEGLLGPGRGRREGTRVLDPDVTLPKMLRQVNSIGSTGSDCHEL